MKGRPRMGRPFGMFLLTQIYLFDFTFSFFFFQVSLGVLPWISPTRSCPLPIPPLTLSSFPSTTPQQGHLWPPVRTHRDNGRPRRARERMFSLSFRTFPPAPRPTTRTNTMFVLCHSESTTTDAYDEHDENERRVRSLSFEPTREHGRQQSNEA